MIERTESKRKRSERGVSLLLIALGLTVLLGLAGLGVDLATLYVARNEAQRAADAGALAGANEFQSGEVANGLMTPAQVAPIAAAQASQVGNQNLIIGQNPSLQTANFSSSCPAPTGVSGGCFDFSVLNDPRITVVVQQNMPTYFMRIFGIRSVPVSATATAEAYTPMGANGPANSVQCLKPWLLPNCDQDHGAPSGDWRANPNCPCTDSGQPCYLQGKQAGQQYFADYFVNPNPPYQVVNPGLSTTGVVGEHIPIKAGNPQASDVPAPGKFWPVFLPSNGTFVCPSCASNDQANSGSNSAALYRENIECCSTTQITCGTTIVQPINGDMVGPTGQGVDCLIHENNQNTGQDTISLDTGSLSVPFIMYAGSLNPYYPAGTPIQTSDSMVTLPLYDGSILCPGNSCPSSVTVTVTGFLQLFLDGEFPPSSTVSAYVLGISSCNGGASQTGNGGTTPVPAVTGTPITVRLIQN